MTGTRQGHKHLLFRLRRARLPVRDLPLIDLDPAQVFFLAHAALAVQVNSRLDPPLAEGDRFTFLRFQVGWVARCSVHPVSLNGQFGHQVNGFRAHTQELDEAGEIVLVHLAADRSVGAATGNTQFVAIAGNPVALHATERAAQPGVVVLSGQTFAVGAIGDARQRVEVRVFHDSLVNRAQRALLAHLRNGSQQPLRTDRVDNGHSKKGERPVTAEEKSAHQRVMAMRHG